jgi:hypothetical protein
MNFYSKNYHGLLIASKWDKSGNVTDLRLLNSKEEIPIYMDSKSSSITSYCKKRVRIKGEIKEGFLHITSLKFFNSIPTNQL